MIILALVSPTGGAGRTSLAISIASHLGMLGRHVALVQADPINNMEYQLGLAENCATGLAQALLNDQTNQAFLKNSIWGFQFLPYGQINLSQQLAIDQLLMEQPDCLNRFFQHSDFSDDMVVVVDLPRWPTAFCQKIMVLSDLNLITLIPDSASILGIDPLLPHLLQSRGASYFLMNRFDSAKVLHLDLWTLCKVKLSHRLLPFYLHEDQAQAESLAAGLPLAQYAPRSQLVEDQQKLCNWIDSEIG